MRKLNLEIDSTGNVIDKRTRNSIGKTEQDEGYLETNVIAIGAPIFDAHGSVVAGLTIAIPDSRYDIECSGAYHQTCYKCNS